MTSSIVVLPDALHARPANLLVRLAAGFASTITIRAHGRSADARQILEVLALGALRGDSIELDASGVDAADAIAALHELAARGFDGDLVPERGEGGAAGVAVGRALVVERREDDLTGPRPIPEERDHLDVAGRVVEADLARMLASLSPAEAPLLEPSTLIVRDLLALARTRVQAGESAAAAVRAVTEEAPTDLVLDARARLLSALAGAAFGFAAVAAGDDDPRVLVTNDLVPSLVTLAPTQVVGIVASRPEGAAGRRAHATSHAVILARGRGLPLAIVPEHVTAGVSDGEWLVVDATEAAARVWIDPSDRLLSDARARRAAQQPVAAVARAEPSAPLDHLGVALRVNIGTTFEEVPRGADGIGLVRTELLHPGWSAAPSEADLILAITTVARRARGGPVLVRLYDAGGDKPLPWLPAPRDDADARGIALLLRHRAILSAQLAALAVVRRDHDVRVLVPMTRSAEDVAAVRAAFEHGLSTGAMIETPEAAAGSDAIAQAADFVCIGTNDLASSLGANEPAGSRRVLSLVSRIVEAGHRHARSVTVCGELAGEPTGARILVGLGVDALSVSPARVSTVRATLGAATREGCRDEARRALGA